MNSNQDRKLTDRERTILTKIVQTYILNANPVGSRFLSKYLKDDLKLSPATIRNVMADLEDMEFISHPHTSAGRVPTDKGYRFYVDSLKSPSELTPRELNTLRQSIIAENNEKILKDVSRALGFISKYLSIVKIPQFKDLIVTKVEIIRLSSQRFLVVIALDSDFVRTVTIESDFEVNSKYLDKINTYINEKISGKPLNFLRNTFQEIMSDFSGKEKPIVRLFTDSLDKVFEISGIDNRIIVTGTQNLLNYPEFEDLSKVKSIIELVEEEDVIVHLLDSHEETDGIKVLIGNEMNNERLSDYSVILSSYQLGSARGSIGLIGPKRMNYPKVMSLIQTVSNTISDNNY